MDEISQLLHAVSNVIVEERTLQEEKRKRGDNFNVFSVLGLQTSEVRLHSALIAELLNPNGDHGLRDKFLEAFLDVLNMHFNDKFIFDTKTAKVEVEHFIGSISDDGETGGRIDLFIQDQYKQTIIIENKIYACDQDRQMSRYNHYAKQNLNLKDEQVRLLYLTLEGDAPSKESCGDEKFDFTCISYKDDLLKWLDKCLMVSALYPIVRETIRQYITTLKNILSIMDTSNNDKFLDILTSDDNVETALTILNKKDEIYKRIRENFIEKIRKLCVSFGYTFKCDEGVKTASNNNWIHISDPQIMDVEFRIGVKSHTNSDGYRMCFVSLTRKKTNSGYKFWQNDNSPTDEFPFGWTYLWGEDDMWWRWDNPNTIGDMVNGKMLKFIESQLQRIRDENVFEMMNKLLG